LYNTIVAGNHRPGASYSTAPNEISGSVIGTNNLIGDPNTAGGLTNGSGGNIVGIGGVSPIPLSTIFATDSSGNPVLASYGGPTQTVALIPGSPAIDAGSTSVPEYQSTDQRGLPRVGAPDIGAFESQGFQLTIVGGNGQTALVGQAFASPLVVTVTPNNPLEPVNGGTISFAPATLGSGPSALLSQFQATIAGGMASVTATANSEPGSYNVAAFGPEATLVEFALTNAAFTPANVQAAIDAAPPGGITLQPTTFTPLNLILTTLGSLGPQASTSKVTVSLPRTVSPYQAITVNLPAGLDFTLDGSGSSVNGNVIISQGGGGDPTVNNLNVTGNLQIHVVNADDGSAVVTQSSVSGNVEIETGNGKADTIRADALIVGGNLQIETGNGDGDSVAVTARSGRTTITGYTEIELGNGESDTATVNGPAGAVFNGSFSLQMGNRGNTVNIGTVAGTVVFRGTVQVQLGNGTNTLNLAATITHSGGVPGSRVYFKKQAVFDGKNGKNTRYVGASGVNVFGAPQFNN
jgi:hypothetical protein